MQNVSERSSAPMIGWLAAAAAVFLIGRFLPDSVRASAAFQAVFVDRWPWYVGGASIGAFVLWMLWMDNKLLGVSTGCAELCAIRRDAGVRRSWRLPFLLGIVLGGVASAMLAGRVPTLAMGAFDTLVGASLVVKVPVLVAGGVLIGYGSRLAGGCTSGHGIVGTAQGAKSRLVATGMFMIAGFATTQLVVWLRG